MKKILLASLILIFGAAFATQAATFSEQLSGRILLQVESRGEAWYVYPVTQQRHYLGRPDDAFAVMRTLSLGIKHDELVKYQNSFFPSRLIGRILLDVENNGAAYYISPRSSKSLYLGRPNDAFNIMKGEGLGITDANIQKVVVATTSIVTPTSSEQQCIDSGGRWAITGLKGDYGCVEVYSDGGKSCTSSAQCQKDCIVYMSRNYGVCQESSNVSLSCHQTIEEYNAGGSFYCQ
jgi:hypothetical protein